MLYKVYDFFKNEVVDEIDLPESIFSMKPNLHVMKQVVDWQLAKKRSGSRKTKNISEVSGTGKKPHAQKGSGRARQGSLRSVHMRGGAVSHGPRVRSHGTDLPKKVRKLGLCSALSQKHEKSALVLVKNMKMDSISTKSLSHSLAKMDLGSSLFVDGQRLDKNFNLSIGNIPHTRIISQMGINVYEVLKYEKLVLSLEALNVLGSRL